MNYRIEFEDGKVFQQPVQTKAVVYPINSDRVWKKIVISGELEEIKQYFVDNAKYVQKWDSIGHTIDPETNEEIEITETLDMDLSEFSIAGEIVDHRDGTYTVLMGKPTELEILRAQLETLKNK